MSYLYSSDGNVRFREENESYGEVQQRMILRRQSMGLTTAKRTLNFSNNISFRLFREFCVRKRVTVRFMKSA